MSSDSTKKKILVIDDDMTALDIVDFLFEEEGFDVSRMSDGQSALDCIGDFKPDIVLVDLMMPQMSGQVTIAKIREQGHKIPIIAFTAIDDPETHQEAKDAGCDLVLTKPCKPKELVGHVLKMLGHSDC